MADYTELKTRFEQGKTFVIVTTRGPGPKDEHGEIIEITEGGNPFRVSIRGHAYSGKGFSAEELTPVDHPRIPAL